MARGHNGLKNKDKREEQNFVNCKHFIFRIALFCILVIYEIKEMCKSRDSSVNPNPRSQGP